MVLINYIFSKLIISNSSEFNLKRQLSKRAQLILVFFSKRSLEEALQTRSIIINNRITLHKAKLGKNYITAS